MQFLDPQHGWALSDQKIWKTSDGGAHWDTQFFGFGGNPSTTALERINDSVAVVAAHYENLFLTKN